MQYRQHICTISSLQRASLYGHILSLVNTFIPRFVIILIDPPYLADVIYLHHKANMVLKVLARGFNTNLAVWTYYIVCATTYPKKFDHCSFGCWNESLECTAMSKAIQARGVQPTKCTNLELTSERLVTMQKRLSQTKDGFVAHTVDMERMIQPLDV